MRGVVDSCFLTAAAPGRARPARRADRTGRAPRGRCGARVELEEWEPQFEITERMLVTPEDAVELSLHSWTTRALLDRAATFDPRLTWEPDAE